MYLLVTGPVYFAMNHSPSGFFLVNYLLTGGVYVVYYY